MFSELITRGASRCEKELPFLALIALFFLGITLFIDQPAIAMWIGFGLAGYSAIANDSIQTLGTFFSSNRNINWKLIATFIGGILIATFVYGWITNTGDVSFGRLNRIPAVTDFHVLHIAAPLILLILTRFKIPVSTTFLLLSVFSSSKTIVAMLEKTVVGYFVAFMSALVIWTIIAELTKRNVFFTEKFNEKKWRVIQWAATAYLWSTWLQQDIANIAVFLPRSVTLNQLIIMVGFLAIGIGLLTYLRGGRIQSIVTEKTDLLNPRSASIVDFTLGTILMIFKEWNDLPMSTTWVFLGLLAGREIALRNLLRRKERTYSRTLALVMKDFSLASIGLVISIIIALAGQGLSFSEFIGTLGRQ